MPKTKTTEKPAALETPVVAAVSTKKSKILPEQAHLEDIPTVKPAVRKRASRAIAKTTVAGEDIPPAKPAARKRASPAITKTTVDEEDIPLEKPTARKRAKTMEAKAEPAKPTARKRVPSVISNAPKAGTVQTASQETVEDESTAEQKSKGGKQGRPSAKELASFCVRAADDKKAEDVMALHVTDFTVVADYFVICTTNSQPQLGAVSEWIRRQALEILGVKALSVAGTLASEWVVVDFGNVIVHVMNTEARARYAIEKLWGDAPRLA